MKDGRDILDRLASHPRVAKFITSKNMHGRIGCPTSAVT